MANKDERRAAWAAQWSDPKLALEVRDAIAAEVLREVDKFVDDKDCDEETLRYKMQLRSMAFMIANYPPTPRHSEDK